MYEVKSAGVTIDLTHNNLEAVQTYERASGPVVELYQYAANGSKSVVSTKYNHPRAVNSFRSNTK